MLSIDDEAGFGEGLRCDYLPQFFEVVEGEVRIRDEAEDLLLGSEGREVQPGEPRP